MQGLDAGAFADVDIELDIEPVSKKKVIKTHL